jgi:O-antigen/teichoic acid export membrane protein
MPPMPPPGFYGNVPFAKCRDMVSAAAEEPTRRSERFFHSVLWSWFGVAVSIFTGVLLSPYIIRKLGDEGYGVWVIIFAVADSFGMMDLGFRSATAKYTAHYRATGELDKLNETLNTAVFFSSAVLLFTICATIFFAGYITRFEHIKPEYAKTFTTLLIMVGLGCASGAVFNLFTACLEGFQRFDISSKIWIVQIAIRAIGITAVLATRHGLLAMGAVMMIALASTYTQTVLAVRKVFPQLKFSRSYLSFGMFRQMFSYGIHTFGAGVAAQILNQSAPVLISHFLPTAFAGYYSQPVRLLQYSVDMVGRVGFVSGSHSAELAAKKDYEAVAQMGIYINRYCFMLFAPFTIALVVYGQELFRLWINPDFALMSAPLLPVVAVGTTLGVAAQFNSSSILYGLGKHQGYAYLLMVEAALCLGGLYWAIPRYGIMGAAWVTSGLIALTRGLITSWLMCRAVHFNVWTYLRGIYVPPLLAAAPVVPMAFWVKQHWLLGNNWGQLIAGSAFLALVYFTLAHFICLEKEHRALPVNWLRKRLKMAG